MAETLEWIEELKAMPFEQLVEKYRPLIAKYSRWNIPGYEPEDIAQEVMTVLWRCQTRFDPSKRAGFNGRPSTFLNYLMTSIENWLGKAPRRFSQSFHAPVTELECRACGAILPVSGHPTCACGGRRWKSIHGGSMLSFDNEFNPIDPEVDGFEDALVAKLEASHVLGQLPEDHVGKVREYMGGTINERQLRSFFKRNPVRIGTWDTEG